MKKSDNKVVVITGGSSGIGFALAQTFGQKGYDVAISGRNVERLNEAVAQLKQSGVNIIGIPGDVSIEKDCELLINSTIESFGGIDVLINNAGMSMRALFKDLDLSVFRKLMDINFHGTVYCTKYALPELLKNKGSVVGISSIAGIHGLPGRSGYSASKFAVEGFLEALRVENLYTGLHVLSVCPGYTESNIRNNALTDSGHTRKGEPLNESDMMPASEVAEHVYNAVTSRKRKIVLTAKGKLTYFLKRLVPAILDKLVYNSLAKEEDSPLHK